MGDDRRCYDLAPFSEMFGDSRIMGDDRRCYDFVDGSSWVSQ